MTIRWHSRIFEEKTTFTHTRKHHVAILECQSFFIVVRVCHRSVDKPSPNSDDCSRREIWNKNSATYSSATGDGVAVLSLLMINDVSD